MELAQALAAETAASGKKSGSQGNGLFHVPCQGGSWVKVRVKKKHRAETPPNQDE
jgi:hypothetical protein